MIYKAAGIIIKDRRLLVARSKGKDMFIAPGGKLEVGETPVQAVMRELAEEPQVSVNKDDLELFGEYTAEAAGQPGKQVHMTVFWVKSFSGTIHPAAEIEELQWVEAGNPKGLSIGSIFEHEVMPRLKKDRLIQ